VSRALLLALFVVGAASLVPAASGSATVPPPVQPGAWSQLGAAVTSRAGKQLHFYRTALSPHALAIVVTSSSARPIRLVWQSYCEFESDDDQTLEDHGTVTNVHTVTAYPSTFPGNTLCYVWVSSGTPGAGTVTSAVFTS
jgi:hypothetical protein